MNLLLLEYSEPIKHLERLFLGQELCCGDRISVCTDSKNPVAETVLWHGGDVLMSVFLIRTPVSYLWK